MSRRKIRTPGVYHDRNGTYYLKYKNKTYRGFKTVEEAEIKKAQLQLKKETVQTVKLSVVIKDYLDNEKSRVKSEEITFGTYQKKESTFRLYIVDQLGDFNIQQLTPAKLRNFRNDLIDLPKSTRTKNRIIESLKSVLNYANKYYEINNDLSQYLDYFPKTSAEKRKTKEKLSYIWTESDFEAFVDGMELNYIFVFTLMFRHGLRLGEAQALRYIDVDFENKTIDINGSITHKTLDGTFERKDTKTENSERVIFVGDTIQIIKKLRKENESKYGFKENWYICNHRVPLTQKMVQRKREKHIKLSGVVPCTNHEMRHMFVTNAWSAGVPISAISNYIGHKNVAITLNTYSHLTQEDDLKMTNYIANLK